MTTSPLPKTKRSERAALTVVAAFRDHFPVTVEPHATERLSEAGVAALERVLTIVASQHSVAAAVRRVSLERFVDVDGGEPPRTLVVVYVHATPEAGNAAWDESLAKVDALVVSEDVAVAAALDDEVSLIYRWYGV